MNCIKCNKPLPDEAVYCMWCGKKQCYTPRQHVRSRKGQGSVCYHKAKKLYYARVTLNRKRIDVGYYRTESEAWTAVNKAIKDNAGSNYNWSVQRCYDEWSKAHYPTLSKSAEQSYQNAWLYLQPIAGMKMRDVKTSHLQKCVDKAANNFTRSVCEKIKSLSSQLCQFAMREDILNKNYAQFLQLPPKEEGGGTCFDDKEVAMLFAHDDDDTVKIILILIFTGLRPNELFNMELRNVDVNERFLRGGSKTEAGRNRVVPIHQKILPYVTYFYMQRQLGQVYLVTNEQGRKIDLNNWRKRKFYPALQAAGITNQKLTPYSCRHTFATMCDRADVDDAAIIKMIGHTTKKTTEKFYIHKSDFDLRTQIDKL